MVGFRVTILAALVLAPCRLPLQAGLNAEAGAFRFQTYSPKVFGANPGNWAIVQDRRGVMYFGNNEGVLEFDGVSWRKIPLTNGTIVRSLAVDDLGTVYAGGEGIFGRLQADPAGTLRFVSLLEKVPETDRKFGNVWTIRTTPKGTYFLSYQRLFRLSPDGKISVWKPANRFSQMFYEMGSLFLVDTKVGLLQMVNDRLVEMAGTNSFGQQAIRSAIPSAAGLLLATPQGFYRFNGKTITPFPTRGDEYFQKNLIYVAHRIPSGEIAVGTRKGGMVLLDEAGQVDRIVGKNEGLPSDNVTGLYTDRDSGVWLTLDSGIVRFDGGTTQFDERQGLKGHVLSIGRQAGVLYAGTTVGLFRMKTMPGAVPVFENISSVGGYDFAFQKFGTDSLVGSDSGIFQVSGMREENIFKSRIVYDLGLSKNDTAVVYAAGRDGVAMLRKEGAIWKKVAEEKGNNQDFRTVVEDNDGRVWATTKSEIWRVDFRAQPPVAERFLADRGVPGGTGWKNAFYFRGHVVFATERGLLRFDEKQQRFVPNPELGTRFSDGSVEVGNLREDAAKNVWITGTGYHGVLLHRAGGKYQWLPNPLVRAGIDELYAFYLDPDGTVWASGEDGNLFRSENSSTGFLNRKVDVLVRSVEVTGKQAAGKKDPFFGGSIALAHPPRLGFGDRALRFEFASPDYQGEQRTEYQVRLDGSDSDWSAWTRETRKDYTNLPEHTYRFRVRARDAHQVVSGEAVFAFRILPPWYRTWWAYLLWLLAGVSVVWTIVRWRMRSLEERNARLEQVVSERTAEVRRQRDQIREEERKSEELLGNILPARIAMELKAIGTVTPMAFDDVTVCFTDFEGFTLSSEKLPPTRLVFALNEYFTAFDEIVGRYGLEKLKTIGDAYMLVSGLPSPRASHALDAVLAAMEMAETVKRLSDSHPDVNWKVRIGLHSGPVVAGVVGVRKFAFDIWGDTVNFAARMESSGLAGRVNMSAATYARVKEFIDCEYRGQVRIKEGRELDMYFALGPKTQLGGTGGEGGIPPEFRRRYIQVYGETPLSFPAHLVAGGPPLPSLV